MWLPDRQRSCVTSWVVVTLRPEAEIDQLLAPTAAEYTDEERAAAEQESHGTIATSSGVAAMEPPQGAD
jgi:hypothetical protein